MLYQSSPPSGVVLSVGACRDDACPRDSCPLSPDGVSGACLSLSRQAYLMQPDLPFSLPKDRDRRKRSSEAA
jgi:hypothetical protein